MERLSRRTQNQTLVIGSGQFIPGFEEQLIEYEYGDEREIKVTFPEYHARLKARMLFSRLKSINKERAA